MEPRATTTPGPGVPVPDPPDTPPPVPQPAPEPSPPPRPSDASPGEDVELELHGSLAIVSGVVEDALERERIVREIRSRASVTRVENHLRPPAA